MKNSCLSFTRSWFCSLLSSLLSSGRVSAVLPLCRSLCSDNPGRCEPPSMPPLPPRVSLVPWHTQTHTHTPSNLGRSSDRGEHHLLWSRDGRSHASGPLTAHPRTTPFIYLFISFYPLSHLDSIIIYIRGFNNPSSFAVLINHTTNQRHWRCRLEHQASSPLYRALCEINIIERGKTMIQIILWRTRFVWIPDRNVWLCYIITRETVIHLHGFRRVSVIQIK